MKLVKRIIELSERGKTLIEYDYFFSKETKQFDCTLILSIPYIISFSVEFSFNDNMNYLSLENTIYHPFGYIDLNFYISKTRTKRIIKFFTKIYE